jgi:hypothetical protein
VGGMGCSWRKALRVVRRAATTVEALPDDNDEGRLFLPSFAKSSSRRVEMSNPRLIIRRRQGWPRRP